MMNKQCRSVDIIQANKAMQLLLTSNILLNRLQDTHTQRERDQVKVRVNEKRHDVEKFQALEYKLL